MNRHEPSFTVSFPSIVRCFPVTADVLTDFRINELVIGLQKDSCLHVILHFSFTGRNEPFECSAVFIREFDNVLIHFHS